MINFLDKNICVFSQWPSEVPYLNQICICLRSFKKTFLTFRGRSTHLCVFIFILFYKSLLLYVASFMCEIVIWLSDSGSKSHFEFRMPSQLRQHLWSPLIRIFMHPLSNTILKNNLYPRKYNSLDCLVQQVTYIFYERYRLFI